MVQGSSGHGGEVAAPIADRILERTLAMDEGHFDMPVAWLAPAHRPNPFQMIAAVDYKKEGLNIGGDDEENADASTADIQMASGGGDPDVEPEADARGKVSERHLRQARAVPAPTPPPRKPNFFERLFGARPSPPQPPPQRPVRRPGTR